MGPDTPIISNVSGVQYIAGTTVNIPQVSTSADSSLTSSALFADYVQVTQTSHGGTRDTPPTTHAG